MPNLKLCSQYDRGLVFGKEIGNLRQNLIAYESAWFILVLDWLSAISDLESVLLYNHPYSANWMLYEVFTSKFYKW